MAIGWKAFGLVHVAPMRWRLAECKRRSTQSSVMTFFSYNLSVPSWFGCFCLWLTAPAVNATSSLAKGKENADLNNGANPPQILDRVVVSGYTS